MFKVLVAVWSVMRAGQWSSAIDCLILSSLGYPKKIFPRGSPIPKNQVMQFHSLTTCGIKVTVYYSLGRRGTDLAHHLIPWSSGCVASDRLSCDLTPNYFDPLRVLLCRTATQLKYKSKFCVFIAGVFISTRLPSKLKPQGTASRREKKCKCAHINPLI